MVVFVTGLDVAPTRHQSHNSHRLRTANRMEVSLLPIALSSRELTTMSPLFIFLVLLLLNMTVPAGASPVNGCVECHSNAETMSKLGYPHFTVTEEEVRRQSGMPASCPECHQGNPGTNNRDEAHREMGRLLLVQKKGLVAKPVERKSSLSFSVNPAIRIRYEIMTGGRSRPDPLVSAILYQDRRADTLSQNFGMMADSCGRCHPKQYDEFRRSTMGLNARQSRYLSWDGEHGPHNCGVWFDTAYANISGSTTVSFSRSTSALNQRACNSCHAGCLDCHYEPSAENHTDKRSGMHRFRKTPQPISCYGDGRGTICHAGPEERRRGAGYWGGLFSYPEGLSGDVHREKGVGCLDCHASSRSDSKIPHGTVERQGSCDRCHGNIIKKHLASVHARLVCEACHIREAGGYQATFWGPGTLGGSTTPYYKYLAYYGVMKDPILIRGQDGRWIPVKPFPMAVMNQRSSATRAAGLYWRWPAGLQRIKPTGDAYGYVGLFGGLPKNNRALLWIQMDKLSHQLGKSRPCDSCHVTPNGDQTLQVRWEYSGEGTFPFTGSHTVVANRKGLSIRNMKADEELESQSGFDLTSFAPWLYLTNRWTIPGDFTLPAIRNRSYYDILKNDPLRSRRDAITH